MYRVKPGSEFERDAKRAESRNYDMALLVAVIEDLRQGKVLDRRYHDHPLKGKHRGYRECHIKPDWLLIYRKDEATKTLELRMTGTHSDLF
jgi:mRNA interferase YafQ